MEKDSDLVSREFHHTDVVVGYPPEATCELTRREMLLPSESGNYGPEESKDQYHRTRSNGEEVFLK